MSEPKHTYLPDLFCHICGGGCKAVDPQEPELNYEEGFKAGYDQAKFDAAKEKESS